MALIKKIYSERVRIELGYWRIIDFTYNCNTGNILISLGGFLNKKAREEDNILNCLDSKSIVLHTKKEIVKQPVMRPALTKDGAYRYDSAGILQLEPSGEIVDERINQESYIEIEQIDLNLTQIYDFLKKYGEFAL